MSSQTSRTLGGFTLMEMLVVLVIISIIFAATQFISPDTHSKRLAHEAERLQAHLQFMVSEAIFTNTDYGWRYYIEEDKFVYGFVEYDHEEQIWRNVADYQYVKYVMPLGYELTLELEGEEVELDESNTESQYTPYILLTSSGEKTPFELYLSISDEKPLFRLSSDGIGDIIFEELKKNAQ